MSGDDTVYTESKCSEPEGDLRVSETSESSRDISSLTDLMYVSGETPSHLLSCYVAIGRDCAI